HGPRPGGAARGRPELHRPGREPADPRMGPDDQRRDHPLLPVVGGARPGPGDPQPGAGLQLHRRRRQGPPRRPHARAVGVSAAGAGGAPLLAIRDLAIDFGTPEEPQPAVRGIDLTVTQGSTLGIVGESGSGKSMSMLSVVSLLPDTARVSGSVQLAGREAHGLGPRELRKIRGSQVGMIFQDPMTWGNRVSTIGDRTGEAIRAHEPGLSRRKAKARAIELLADVSIPRPAERARSYPFELSGGMRQRVMIAIAIANNPALLIAD